MTQITLREIAELVGGKLTGNPDLVVSDASTIRDVRDGEITLADKLDLANKLHESSASAVIVNADFAAEIELKIPAVIVDNVHASFAEVVSVFRPIRHFGNGTVSPHAVVAESATVAEGVTIHANATIGEKVEIESGAIIHSGVAIMDGCRIGADTQIFPNSVLYENTIIGERCLIHANSVIGAYGFGYDSSSGQHHLSSQLGCVLIEDDVELGAGTTVDRGTYSATRIGAGTKIDNQVMVAHNCSIGKHNLICSQVGIAGSCSTGDYVVLAGQVGMADHLHIGSGVIVGAKSGVMHDLTEKGVYFGIPCFPHRERMKQLAAIRKLPDTLKQIKRLNRELSEMNDSGNICGQDTDSSTPESLPSGEAKTSSSKQSNSSAA